MKAYIHSSSSISVIDSFNGINMEQTFPPISNDSSIQVPDYKKYISPIILRRMGKVTRMATACAYNCLASAQIEKPLSITVGTGLGALKDTEKFLQNSLKSSGGLIPPTAFIQSGHNTISGQIALLLAVHEYNMTHVQKGFSFEHALLDSFLQLQEGTNNILVGAVDEKIDFLETLAQHFQLPEPYTSQLSEGASFFMIGNEQKDSQVELNGLQIFQNNNFTNVIHSFLDQHHLTIHDISYGFTGHSLSSSELPPLPFPSVNYTDICGQYFSSSGFGMHFAYEWMKQKMKPGERTLVINHHSDSLAIILLTRV